VFPLIPYLKYDVTVSVTPIPLEAALIV